jgi:hypothetical protein
MKSSYDAICDGWVGRVFMCVDEINSLNISSTVSGFSTITSASPKVIEKISGVMHRLDAHMISHQK